MTTKTAGGKPPKQIATSASRAKKPTLVEAPAQEATIDVSQMAFNQEAVLTVASQTYPDNQRATMELIQNAIDAGGKRVVIWISLAPKDRHVIVQDNGVGCSLAQFESKVGSMGTQTKSDSALGKFGIGLIAFYGKAKIFHFTSVPKGSKNKQRDGEGYNRHDLGNIRLQDGKLFVQRTRVTAYEQQIPWFTTEVVARDFPKGGSLGLSLDRLEREVSNKYGKKIKENGTTVEINFTDPKGAVSRRVVTPQEFTGSPFGMSNMTGQTCGRVRTTLYRSGDKAGQVFLLMGASSYRLPWGDVTKQAIDLGMDAESAEGLRSGMIEGEIWIERADIMHNRSQLPSTDETYELLGIIEGWMKEVGLSFIRQTTDKNQDAMEYGVLSDAVKRIGEIYDALGSSSVRDALALMPAAVSKGHTPVEGEVQVRATGGGHSSPKASPGNGGGQREAPKTRTGEQKTRFHTTVAGKGDVRIVSDTQSGLCVALEDLEGQAGRYQVLPDKGIIAVNRRHPDYLARRESKDKLRTYIDILVEYAVAHLLISEDVLDQLKEAENALFAMRLYASSRKG